MKKIYAIIFLLIATVSIGCKKDKTDKTDQAEKQFLIGNWKMTSSTGGSIPITDLSIYSLKITDTNFERYTSNKLDSSLPYTLSTGISPATNKSMRLFVFTGMTNSETYFELSGDKLTIYYGSIAYDGTMAVFQRQ